MYGGTIRAIDWIARRVTRTVQSGSLPTYLLVILTTVVVVPVIPMLAEFGELPQLVENPIQLPIVTIIIASSIGAALIRRRIAAVVMLGAVGFAMAALYETQGAPDLALTQFAIETLGTVLFVLVLRFLPDAVRRPRAGGRAPASLDGVAAGGSGDLRLRDRVEQRTRRCRRGIDLGRDGRAVEARR